MAATTTTGAWNGDGQKALILQEVFMFPNGIFVIGRKALFAGVLLPAAMFAASALPAAPGAAKPSTTKTIKAKPEVRLDSASRARLASAYGNLPLSFTANEGQADSRVKFLSRSSGYALFLTGDEAVLALRQPSVARRPTQRLANKMKPGRKNGVRPRGSLQRQPTDKGSGPTDTILRMRLAGANPSARVTGLDELPGRNNYFIGNDPKKWRTDVPNYAKVEYRSVYPGVDLVYYGNHRQLEYDFVVARGSNPAEIKLGIGADPLPARKGRLQAAPLRIAANGDLVVAVAGGEVRLHKPVVYQPAAVRPSSVRGGLPGTAERQPRTTDIVPAAYVLNGHDVSFKIAHYDRTRPLIIDPVLTYSSLLGGSGFYGEWGSGIAADAAGNVYLTGITDSPDFPIVNQIPGACNGYCGDGLYTEVAFVTEINAAGDAIVYSSFIGGSEGPDYGTSIALDSAGAVYLAGVANSSDFPEVNQIPGACNNGQIPGACYISGAVFAAKIDAAGDTLVYSSMIGGENGDNAFGIAVDTSGGAYLTGFTDSTDFPIVNQISGACVSTCGGGNSVAFVAEVNAAGTALDYSSLLGGDNEAYGNAIALDGAGNVYVAGETDSTDFPEVNPTSGACVGACGTGNSYYDGFVTEINAAGSALAYSTLIGGSQGGLAEALALDASGNIYLAGYTTSADFPQVDPIPGACQGTCGTGDGANPDAFVAKINAGGSALAYSSLLGGSGAEEAYGIAVDPAGNAFLTGQTSSTDFPLVNPISGACQQGCGSGPPVAFVTEVGADASALAYSSFLGGNTAYLGDAGSGLRVDAQDNVYLTGYATSTNFPQVNQIPGACNGTCGQHGNFEVVAVKISSSDRGEIRMQPDSMNFGPQPVGTRSKMEQITLTNDGQAPLSIFKIALVGSDSGDFAERNNCPISPNRLAAGRDCTLTAIFAPNQQGKLSAAIAVRDNAADSPQKVPMFGMGAAGR
jgi:Beta-propeller repeat